MRFGHDLWNATLEIHGIEHIYIADDPDTTSEVELSRDVLMIIHHFSSKSYSARSALKTTKHLDESTILRIRELHAKNVCIEKMVRKLEKENYKTSHGDSPSRYIITKYLESLDLFDNVPNKGINISPSVLVENFWSDSMKTRKDNKVAVADVYSLYQTYCGKLGVKTDNVRKFGQMKKDVPRYSNGKQRFFVGWEIKKGKK